MIPVTEPANPIVVPRLTIQPPPVYGFVSPTLPDQSSVINTPIVTDIIRIPRDTLYTIALMIASVLFVYAAAIYTEDRTISLKEAAAPVLR